MTKKKIAPMMLSVILCLGCIYFAKEKLPDFLEKFNREPKQSTEDGTDTGNVGEEDYEGWIRDGVEHEPIPEISEDQVCETGAVIQGADDLHRGSKPLAYELTDYFFVESLEQLEEIEGYQESPEILYHFDENGNFNPEKFGNLLCLEYRVTNLEDHAEIYAPYIGSLIAGWKNGRAGAYITGCIAERMERDSDSDDSVSFQAGETKTMHELVCIYVPSTYIDDDMTAELLISPACNSTWDVNSSTLFYHLPLSEEQKETIRDNSRIYMEYLEKLEQEESNIADRQ